MTLVKISNDSKETARARKNSCWFLIPHMFRSLPKLKDCVKMQNSFVNIIPGLPYSPTMCMVFECKDNAQI